MQHHASDLSRRTLLKSGLLAGTAAALGGSAPARAPTSRPRTPFRVAHLSDIHVQPERRAPEGLASCLKHLMARPQRPDLVITGGDLIMDGFDQGHARTTAQWDLFNSAFKDGCPLPVEHTLGNHDIWGWNKTKSKTAGTEPGWGKRWFCEMAGREKPYTALTRGGGGWKIVLLDSVHTDPQHPDGYLGKLDDEQFAWLESELKATPAATPILIISHIPILTVTHLIDGKMVKGTEYRYSGGLTHLDAARLHRLFVESGKVKLCLSGHRHRTDRVEIDGLSYICDGAVCGGWWKGPGGWCDEGYGVVDLFDDGTFAHAYERFGWTAAG